MPIKRQFFIYKDLKDSNKYKELGIHYNGENNQSRDKNHERFINIIDTSMEQIIIAVWMEIDM